MVIAHRVGRGLVIRTGLPEWSRRLGTDREVAEVMRRMWTLLSQ